MKGYLSVREVAYKWNVSESRVHKLCQTGRIPELERFGRSWAIPIDAEKPIDPRRNKSKPVTDLCVQSVFSKGEGNDS